MEKKFLAAVFTLALLALAAVPASASYTVFGLVYQPDGSTGLSSDANSNCGLKAYRKGIPGEIGRQLIGPDGLCTEKIFWANYNPGVTAYYNSDVGSALWPSAVALNQEVVAVVEAYDGQFNGCAVAWSGGSYVGARKKVLASLDDDINSGECNLPDTRVQPVPAPQVSSVGASDVTLTWTGIAYDPDDLIVSYTVYRSTEPGGAGGFGEIGTAAQNKGGTVTYNDSGLSVSYTYYYQLAVNFEWGGGNGAPAYFVSNARSAVTGGVYTAYSPTPVLTATETPVFSSTFTSTASNTEVDTATHTPTATETATGTYTETGTYTCTMTLTLTATPTLTSTATLTASPTASGTVTPTVTATSALAANLDREKLVILNGPVTDGRLQIGLYSAEAGTVTIYVYNINGELVFKTAAGISEGANIINEEFKKARGVYILRAVMKTHSGMEKPPLKKFVVTKNLY